MRFTLCVETDIGQENAGAIAEQTIMGLLDMALMNDNLHIAINEPTLDIPGQWFVACDVEVTS